MTRCLWIFLAACLALTTSPLAWSAPHISGKPEPFISKPGLPFHQRALAQNRARALAPATYPATVKVLFLRVDFPVDTNVTTTGSGVWADPSYAHAGDADYWVNKNRLAMINYYAEVSYGKLTLDITVSPTIYRLPKTMAQYGNETPAYLENLIFDSVTAADATTDFAAYDAIMIIHAGAGEETDISNNTPGDIWSLHYADASISTGDSPGAPPLKVDGISITEALIMSQTGTQDGDTVDPLGIYVHEFGHWLGLPDLYSTSLAPDWDGIGVWGLMGGGIYTKGADGITGSAPAHLEAWSKVYLKWVVPQTFSTDTDPGMQTLTTVETNEALFKLPASPTTPTQYYLLENRRKSGFDTGLPGEGLLIWLVDELAIAEGIPNNTVNNNRARPGIKLIEADGDNALHTFGGDDGSGGDPFPGQTGNAHFTPRTVPAAIPPDGNAWVYIKNISVDALSNVALTLEFAPAAPTNVTATLNGTGTSLQWNAPSATDLAFYSVYKNGVLLSTVNLSTYSDVSVAAGDTYHVTATDANGNESARSLQVTPIPAIVPQKDKRCFIATAAYGSYQAPYVTLLREFRDDYLLPHAFGTALVNFYYAVSPPIAQFIAQHESIKAMVRVLLLPCIALAFFFVKLGAGGKLVVVLIGVMMGLAGHQGLKKARHKIRLKRNSYLWLRDT